MVEDVNEEYSDNLISAAGESIKTLAQGRSTGVVSLAEVIQRL
jgi:hypothetical protein